MLHKYKNFGHQFFRDELKESTLLASLVNKDYEGIIKSGGGDTVRVSQIIRPLATRKKIGQGADTFETQKLKTQFIDIVADTRISAAYEFNDLVALQSQIRDQDSKIRTSLYEALEIDLNNFLYEHVAPSAADPDHILTGVADLNHEQLAAIRVLAGEAKWSKADGWYQLLSPQYYGDLLKSQTLTSQDYVGGETPMIAGQVVNKRFNFNILEDNSRIGRNGLVFHPDFLHLVMQQEPEIKISDLHGNKQYGYVMSVNFICGAKLGIGGDKLHMTVEN